VPRFWQIAAADAPAHRIARAVRWLTDHFVEPFRVDVLARHAGICTSALKHFKKVTTLSPIQLQQRLRLQ
jgi:transcriptional regulator GlxA family with amidase domain